MNKVDKLTLKQARFAVEYTKDLNGTQAAIRSGYAKGSAAQTATVLLRNPAISEKIHARLTKLNEKASASAEKVIETLAVIANTTNASILKRDEEGNLTGELDLEKLGALPTGELSFGRLGLDENGTVRFGVKKVKMASVLGALELLGKYHKLFTDKVEHDLGEELIRKLNEGRARVGKPPVNIKGGVIKDAA